MSYSVVFSTNAIKDLHSIPREYQKKIISKAESLGNHPYPEDSVKLKGIRETLRRIRVGQYISHSNC
jgi:mRNA interferase RelE/StbE